MPSVRTHCLVLRSVEVFETSSVLTLFTRELGKVSALAKGARRLKSPFQSALDLLCLCDIVLLHKASEALDLLTEAELLECFDAIRRDLSAIYAGYYISELLNELTHHHDPHPRLFDAAVVTLRHLDDPVLRPRRILRFELACLRELGLMPALETCVGCGAEIGSQGGAMAFGLATGGVLCDRCRPGQPSVTLISEQTLRAIRSLAEPGTTWRDPSLDTRRLAPVRSTVSALVSHQLGFRPRMLDYLERAP